MFNSSDLQKIADQKKKFFVFIILTLLFFSGSTFSFTIPYSNDFQPFTYIVVIGIYFLIGNLFVGIIIDKAWIVFFISLILASMGMGWRFWLEWGEFSLIQHSQIFILIAYPTSISLIITFTYVFFNKFKKH